MDSEQLKDILLLISQILQKGESCYLPGIGILKATYHPAKEKDNHIFPPQTTFSFIPKATEEEKAVTKKLVIHFQLTEEKAKKTWEEACQKIIQSLEKGTPVIIPGLGELKQNKEENISFQSYTSPALYSPVAEQQISISEEEEMDSISNEKKSKSVLYTLLIIVVILLLGSFIYFYYFDASLKQVFNNFSKEEDPEELVEKLDSTQQASTIDSVAKVNNTQSENDSIFYVVIYRKHNSKSAAIDDYNQKTGWGYHVEIYTRDSTHFLVGYPIYSLPEDTTKNLEEKHRIYQGHTFIIYPKKQGYQKLKLPKQ